MAGIIPIGTTVGTGDGIMAGTVAGIHTVIIVTATVSLRLYHPYGYGYGVGLAAAATAPLALAADATDPSRLAEAWRRPEIIADP